MDKRRLWSSGILLVAMIAAMAWLVTEDFTHSGPEVDLAEHELAAERESDAQGHKAPLERVEPLAAEESEHPSGRVLIASEARDVSAGELAASDQSSDTMPEREQGAVARQIVRFVPSDGPGEDGRSLPSSLLVAGADAASEVNASIDWIEEGVELLLPDGEYIAALVSLDGEVGPVVGFAIEGAASTVGLDGPTPFDLAMSLVSSSTRDPLATGKVRCRRSLPKGLEIPAEADREAVADSAGNVLMKDLWAGTWAFKLQAEGYGDYEFTLDLPGDWKDGAGDSGVVELGELELLPVTPLLVRLQGARSWGGAENFRIAHTAEGEPVGFDLNGEAVVSLGWFQEPVLLKLWYPGEQMGLMYVDAGLPETGQPLLIDVGQDRSIDVDIQVTPEAVALIDGVASNLRITFRSERGDSMLVGFPVDGAGNYSVPAIHGSRALVEFSTEVGDDVMELATESVVLEAKGATACTLTVTGAPRAVRLQTADGMPIVGQHVEVREVGDATTWLCTGTTDASGSMTVPTTLNSQYSVRSFDEDARTMIVDQRLRLASDGGPSTLLADYSQPRFVTVFVDGQGRQGITVGLFGRYADIPVWKEATDLEGRTAPWRISRESHPYLKVRTKDLWSEAVEFEFVEGENRIDLYTTGSLQVGKAIDLGTVRHAALGGSLAAWIEAGSVVASAVDRGGALGSYRVPAGGYIVTRDHREPESVYVATGATVVLD